MLQLFCGDSNVPVLSANIKIHIVVQNSSLIGKNRDTARIVLVGKKPTQAIFQVQAEVAISREVRASFCRYSQ